MNILLYLIVSVIATNTSDNIVNVDAADFEVSSWQLGLELGGYTASQQNSRTTVVLPTVYGSYQLNPKLKAYAMWGAVHCNQHGDVTSTSTTKASNPFISLTWS